MPFTRARRLLHPGRLLLPLMGLLLAAPVSALPPPPAAPPLAPSTEPARSVVLILASPGLLDRLATLGPLPGTAAELQAHATRHALLLARHEADLARREARLLPAIRALGGTVVGRQRALWHGLLVHAPTAALPRLRALDGVAELWPAPVVRPSLAASGPRIGAPALREQTGWDGTGQVIAILDTGIDYSHAMLGGPGTAAAYQQAAAAADRIDDLWEGKPLFPNAKVIGGHDFVGANYTHPGLCPPEKERAGLCTGTPHPDPDPLDQQGHGSHVASIAAGLPAGSLAAGIAPGASLVALKLYGPPLGPGIATDEAVDVLLDALDWCALVNLGRPVPGTAPPRVDVINMSLSEPWGQGVPLLERGVQGALAAGILVVASAGNAGGQPYILGAPGAVAGALTVANTALINRGNVVLDQVASSSSRGPGAWGALKPDLAAPGSSIMAAAMASGSGGRLLSGTSMSSPHVAGAAAVLLSRSRAQGLGLAPRDLGALLVSTAATKVLAADGSGAEAPVTLAGAGRLDLLSAGRAVLLPRAGDFAALGFGIVELTETQQRLRRTVRVGNLAAEELWVMARGEWRKAGTPIAWLLPTEPVRLPPRGKADLEIGLQLRAEDFGTGLEPFEQPGAAAMDRLEMDGRLTLLVTDAEGRPRTEFATAQLPVQLLPRRASRISGRAASEPGGDLLRLRAGAFAGKAEIYAVPELAGVPAPPDPDEPELALNADLWETGLREMPGAGTLDLLLSSREATALAIGTLSTVYIDRDEDGRMDLRLRLGSLGFLSGGGLQGPQLGWGLATLDAAGQPGPERVQGLAGAPLLSGALRLALPLADLGMTEGQAFRFAVQRQGVSEDWYGRPAEDWAPDGASATGGPRYRFDPRASGAPERWQAEVLIDQEIRLSPPAGAGPRHWEWLAFYPQNAGQPAGAQVQRLRPAWVELVLPLLFRTR